MFTVKKLRIFLEVFSLIVAVAVGSTEIVTNYKNKLFPPKVELTEDYLFLSFVNNVNSSRQEVRKMPVAEKRARDFIYEITGQHKLMSILLNESIVSAFDANTEKRVREYFCSSVKSRFKDNIKGCYSSGEADDYGHPLIATYMLTNTNGFVLRNVEVVMIVFDNESKPIDSYDYFLDGSFVKNNCLYVKNDSQGKGEPASICIAKSTSGRVLVYKVDYLKPGESVVIPMYNWFAEYYDGGNEDAAEWGGYIAVPMTYPIKVKVDGREVIAEPKKMSITPKLTLGEFEIRG